jgi:hypothetical protein
MSAKNKTAAPVLDDPRLTERMGTRLAERLRDHKVNVVVCWDANEDVVLAHVVARELGVGLRIAQEVEGIVTLERPLPDDAIVALVAEDLSPRTAVAGLSGVVHHAGARIAAVATARTPAIVAGTRSQGASVITAEEA